MVIAEQAKQLYKTTLAAYAKNNRIITVDEKDSLDKMAEFLSMEASAVEEIHAEVGFSVVFCCVCVCLVLCFVFVLCLRLILRVCFMGVVRVTVARAVPLVQI